MLTSRLLYCLLALKLFSVASAAAQAFSARSLDLLPLDLLYEASRDRVYAITDSGAGQRQLHEIDPNGPAVVRVLPLAEGVNCLALARSGKVLYAYSNGPGRAIYRIHLESLQTEEIWRPSFDSASTRADSQRLYSLVPLGEDGKLFAAAFGDEHGNAIGTALFDGEKARQRTYISRPVTQLYDSGIDGIIYGYTGSSSGFQVIRLRATEDGLEAPGAPISRAADGFGRRLRVVNGLLHGANGTIFDVENQQRAGWVRSSIVTFAWGFAVDSDNKRVYYATNSGRSTILTAHDLETFLPVATLNLPPEFDSPLPSDLPKRIEFTKGGDLVISDGNRRRLLFLSREELTAIAPWAGPGLPQELGPQIRLIRAPVNFLSADRINGKLLATMQGRVAGMGNSLLWIDPTSGQVEQRRFVGAEPMRAALSPSGRSVFVPVSGESAVKRWSIATGEMDLKVPVRLFRSGPDRGAAGVPSSVAPLPGSEDSFVVMQVETPESETPVFDSLQVFDGAQRRPKTIDASQARMNTMAVSDDGRELYSLNREDSRFGFYRFRLTPEGVEATGPDARFGSDFSETLHCDDNLCGTTAGTLIAGDRMARLGRLPAVGGIVIDKSAGRAFVLGQRNGMLILLEFDVQTAKLTRQAPLPVAGPAIDLCRWGKEGFAALTREGILVMDPGILREIAEPSPPPNVTREGVTRMGFPVSSMAVDRERGLVYASVRATSAAYANEVVAIDLTGKSVVRRLPVGADPSALRMTSDGKWLYVGLQTADSIVKINLETWEADGRFRVPASPVRILPRPGDNERVAVIFDQGPRIGFGGGVDAPDGVLYFQGAQQLASEIREPTAWAITFPGDGLLTARGKWLMQEDRIREDVRINAPALSVPGVMIRENRLYGEMGRITDMTQMNEIAQLDEFGPVWADTETRRLYYLRGDYFLRGDAVRIYDMDSLRLIGQKAMVFQEPLVSRNGGGTDIAAAGREVLVVRWGSELHLVDLATAQWEP